jgi:hypothetical protein
MTQCRSWRAHVQRRQAHAAQRRGAQQLRQAPHAARRGDALRRVGDTCRTIGTRVLTRCEVVAAKVAPLPRAASCAPHPRAALRYAVAHAPLRAPAGGGAFARRVPGVCTLRESLRTRAAALRAGRQPLLSSAGRRGACGDVRGVRARNASAAARCTRAARDRSRARSQRAALLHLADACRVFAAAPGAVGHRHAREATEARHGGRRRRSGHRARQPRDAAPRHAAPRHAAATRQRAAALCELAAALCALRAAPLARQDAAAGRRIGAVGARRRGSRTAALLPHVALRPHLRAALALLLRPLRRRLRRRFDRPSRRVRVHPPRWPCRQYLRS